MLSFALVYILTAAAIANLSAIMAESDPMAWAREKVAGFNPKLGELVSCKYCLGLWMSLAAGLLSIPAWYHICGVPWVFQVAISWFSMHFFVCFLHNKFERMANDAPFPLYVMLKNVSSDGEKVG